MIYNSFQDRTVFGNDVFDIYEAMKCLAAE